MNKLIKSVFLICTLTTCVAHATVALTPNQNNGSGQIPSGYSDITFTLSRYNTVDQVYLPSTPAIGDKVTIVANDGVLFYIDTSNTDIPTESVSSGYSITKIYTFTYDPYKRGWSYQPDSVALTNNIIPITSNLKIYTVTINDANWQSELDFAVYPTKETKYMSIGHLVKVESTASKPVSIKSNNTLYPGGSFVLNKGESLWFEYLPRAQKWVRVGFGMGIRNPIAQLPTIFDSRFYTNYLKGSVQDHVLPSVAVDRAEAFIGSSSIDTENPVISKVNTSYPVDLTTSDLKDRTTGRTIELFTKNKTLIHYMYVADRQHWVPMFLKPADYSSRITHGSTNVIDYFASPIVYVKFDNSNYVSDFNLNSGNGVKHAITLENTTSRSINVALGQGRSEKLLPGERARFQYSNGFNPVKVSHTIDLLLVNSPEVSNAIGASAAKIRLLEAVALTNQISENSNANMYLRVAGYLEYAVNGVDLLGDLEEVTDNAKIQTERARLGADGVSYQSFHTGGGKAWIRAQTPREMTAVQSYDLGLITMAHEIGHNLGLIHYDDTGYDPNQYQKGFYTSDFGKGTMMNAGGDGSGFPYYSSPNLYDPRYLSRIGNDVDADSVKQINRHAPIISAFATATQQ